MPHLDAVGQNGYVGDQPAVTAPLGGWLCDHVPPTTVLATVFAVVSGLALLQSTKRELQPFGGVTGVVGPAGGLGGFVPPLVMGSVYGATGSYAIGLVLLSLTAAAATAFTLLTVRTAKSA